MFSLKSQLKLRPEEADGSGDVVVISPVTLAIHRRDGLTRAAMLGQKGRAGCQWSLGTLAGCGRPDPTHQGCVISRLSIWVTSKQVGRKLGAGLSV